MLAVVFGVVALTVWVIGADDDAVMDDTLTGLLPDAARLQPVAAETFGSQAVVTRSPDPPPTLPFALDLRRPGDFGLAFYRVALDGSDRDQMTAGGLLYQHDSAAQAEEHWRRYPPEVSYLRVSSDFRHELDDPAPEYIDERRFDASAVPASSIAGICTSLRLGGICDTHVYWTQLCSVTLQVSIGHPAHSQTPLHGNTRNQDAMATAITAAVAEEIGCSP